MWNLNNYISKCTFPDRWAELNRKTISDLANEENINLVAFILKYHIPITVLNEEFYIPYDTKQAYMHLMRRLELCEKMIVKKYCYFIIDFLQLAILRYKKQLRKLCLNSFTLNFKRNTFIKKGVDPMQLGRMLTDQEIASIMNRTQLMPVIDVENDKITYNGIEYATEQEALEAMQDDEISLE